jgi:DNA repair exonuclease SbcCD nuclease subunit
MKFLYITDSHGKVRGPSSRTDLYPETVLRKFTEIGEVARKEKVAAIFHGGDLFDAPRVVDSHKGDLGQLIRSWGIDMYVTPGNHDLYGNALSSLPSTALGLLYKHGICKPLIRSGVPVRFTEGSTSVTFTGQEYHMELDRRDPALDYYVDEDFFVNYRVLLVHGMMLPKAFIPEQAFTMIADIPVDTPTTPDLILCGHYHPGFPTVVRGAQRPTSFMNIGSMLRTDAGWDNMERDPQYAIIEVTPKGGLCVTAHKFTSALPSSIVLDRSVRDAANARSKTLEAFRNTIDTSATMQGMDVLSIMNNIALSEGLAEELREAAVKSIESAEQLVDDMAQRIEGFVEKKGTHHIARVDVENFQSWERLSIDIGPGLNVITGTSDHGKSAILRAIRWVLYNEPRGANFIRWGAKKKTEAHLDREGVSHKLDYEVRVALTFTDGTTLIRARTEKAAGYYMVINPDGETDIYKSFSHNPPPDIYSATQMPKIYMTKGVEKSLNLQTQHEGAFLLSDEPSVRAGAIGRLTGVQVVDAAIGQLGKGIANGQREVKSLQRDQERLVSDLAQFTDLEAEHRTINTAEILLADSLQLQGDMEFIGLHADEIGRILIDREITETQLSVLQSQLGAEPLLTKASELPSQVAFIGDMIGELQSVTVESETLQGDLARYQHILSVEDLASQASLLHSDIEIAVLLRSEIADVTSELLQVSTELAQASHFIHATDPINQARALAGEITELQDYVNELSDIEARLINGRVVIAERGQVLQDALSDFTVTLRELGTCPTCYSPIADDVLSEIVTHHLHGGA